MKTARDRALDALHSVMGVGFSRETFTMMVEDKSDNGRHLKKLCDAVERAIEADRTEQEKARSPS